ncbi:MAG: glycosyl hydrolase family 28 protein [Luteolibacter sp.]
MNAAPVLLAFMLSPATLLGAPGASVDAVRSGVVADGVTLNTAAIQRVIDALSADGGGILTFPAGRYLTGTIQLKDKVTLHLEKDAVLLGSTNSADYRNVDPFIDGTGEEMGYALIVTTGAKNAGITGPGNIDGQGKAVKAAQGSYTIRPFLVRWVNCTDIRMSDVHLVNAGAWTLNLFHCSNATLERLTIRSRGLANNDGIDADSCDTVRITDCDIDTGDDAICLKATSPRPCRNVTVSGCRLTSSCAAIKLGTESLGDFETIRISDCRIRDTRLGGIKLVSVDGSNLHDVTLSDIAMDKVTVPIMLRLGARLKTFRAGDAKRPVGTLRDVSIRNVHANGSGQIGILASGVPGHCMENLLFENIAIELGGGSKAETAKVMLPEKENSYPEVRMFGADMPAYGIYARHVRGIAFKNVKTTVINLDARPEKVFFDVEGVTPADFTPAR